MEVPGAVLTATAQFFSAPGPYDVADLAALSWWRGVVLRYGIKTAMRPRLDREALSLLEHDLVVDSSRLRALGWTPRHGHFQEGIADVLRWYQAEGWVPRY